MSTPAPDTEGDDSLAALLPQTRAVQVGGRTVTVRELTIAEIQPVVTEFRRVLAAVGDTATAADLIAGSLDSACIVAAACTTIPADAWRRAAGAKLLAVVQAAVQVNLDFFVRCAELLALLGAITNPANGDGPTRSATSSDAAMPSP